MGIFLGADPTWANCRKEPVKQALRVCATVHVYHTDDLQTLEDCPFVGIGSSQFAEGQMKRFPCTQCDCSFSMRTNLHRHVKKTHSQPLWRPLPSVTGWLFSSSVKFLINLNYCVPPLMPSVLWRSWLGNRLGIRPVKTEWYGAGVVICLERGVCVIYM